MTLREEEFNRKWESLGFSSDFIFGKVMQDRELCEELLRVILPDIEIGHVDFPEKQKTISEGVDIHGVRLDIFTRDDLGKLFNMEMEGRRRRYLVKRTRGYHIQIGMNAMDREQMKTYDDLPDTYVIFICDFDPFGFGRHIYTFRNCCKEESMLELEDGAYTIFLNACGTMDDVSPKLKAFLEFVRGNLSDDPLVRKLDARVREAKQNPDWRREFMTLSMMMNEEREEGRAEGRAEGREEERQVIRDRLIAGGMTPQEAAMYTGLSQN